MERQELAKEFVEIFGGTEADIRYFASPGRVNMIGEHVDYNGGYVFPAALSMRTMIAVRPNGENVVRLAATDLPDRVALDLDRLEDYKDLHWGDYQAAVIWALKEAGYPPVGCDMLFDDTTPHGGGLSSSAAIEVATAIAMATLSNEARGVTEPVDNVQMAKLGQLAENQYIGVQCGIMDQFASAMGKKNHAIFLDCKDLSYKLVPLNIDGCKVVIANTNKKRSLADSKYNERRSECEQALAILQTAMPEKACLAAISPAEWEANKQLITDPILAKRAEHVVYECDRVLQSVEALNRNDIAAFGKLMNGSHDSLRDLYEVTGIELDTLVEESRKIDGVIGSRMTGAGFGGCTVSIVKEEAVERFMAEVGKRYEEKIGYAPSFYISDIGDGGREIK